MCWHRTPVLSTCRTRDDAGVGWGASLTARCDLRVGAGWRAAGALPGAVLADQLVREAVTWLLKNLSHLVQSLAELYSVGARLK